MNDMTTTSIWQKPIDLASIAATGKGTAGEHLGIEVHTILDDGLVARMPVDARTRQPMGLLHGGVSVVLAETLGSLGAYFASSSLRFLVSFFLMIYGNRIYIFFYLMLE